MRGSAEIWSSLEPNSRICDQVPASAARVRSWRRSGLELRATRYQHNYFETTALLLNGAQIRGPREKCWNLPVSRLYTSSVPKYGSANVHDEFDLGGRETRCEPQESLDCAILGVHLILLCKRNSSCNSSSRATDTFAISSSDAVLLPVSIRLISGWTSTFSASCAASVRRPCVVSRSSAQVFLRLFSSKEVKSRGLR